MESFVTPLILGIVIVVLGICNTKGNLSSIHWYHRQRVTEQDKKIFGKLMGTGTILSGIGIILFSIFNIIDKFMKLHIFEMIGSFILTVCLVLGLGISFYAMLKYNKGIF